ncbi:gastrula zinc finger protein XlCGF28.1-like [Silurus asotus]|uniref:Gastrula zinc finger protein XlCGF28.1-like n=1 Tax=Silurus asotus TaxID=30991 RepID=A0AAD5FLP2_SILAS|nr:gastrula zinc finger protein XlCGF28.1-like [Silurus asotus]
MERHLRGLVIAADWGGPPPLRRCSRLQSTAPAALSESEASPEWLDPPWNFLSVWMAARSLLGVLRTVEKGCVIQFMSSPPRYNGMCPALVGPEQALVLEQGVCTLLRNRAIEVVPSSSEVDLLAVLLPIQARKLVSKWSQNNALNDFYARFEVQNNVVARKTIPPPTDQVLCLTTAEVRKTLCRVNPRKSAGPDNIPGRVLRECAEQLADVFTDIFNISLSSNIVPTCLKTTTIVPVPKKSTVSCLNDYRPVALTPIVMKCFERLVMRHIKTQLPPSLDPMQFAYRPNRSTDDAISTTLHLALTHLDNKDSYVRMLFIDFSSAFNTIIPQHLIEKLNLLGLNTSLCNWILDFLTGRPQAVRIRNSISSTTTLSTGAPQGCVLSPLLFTLLTHDCAPMHSSNHIIKFADDTTVVGLISRNDESAYREEVQRLTAWCGANNLSLNVDKTKEMVVDFRRAQSDLSPVIIDGSSVEIVKSTKFLGVHLADNLTWSLNTSSITKKAQQRLYFLRRLRKAHLPPPILSMFYRGTIESILSSCITAWFGNCTVSDRKTLQRIVRTAEKIIGVSLPSIMDIYTTRCIRKAHSIVDDHTHPSHTYFTLLPSGKRFRSIRAVTTRLCNSFFPQAIRLLNTKN